MDSVEKYELTISNYEIKSIHSLFTMDNLSLGDYNKIVDIKFERADGRIVRRRKNLKENI